MPVQILDICVYMYHIHHCQHSMTSRCLGVRVSTTGFSTSERNAVRTIIEGLGSAQAHPHALMCTCSHTLNRALSESRHDNRPPPPPTPPHPTPICSGTFTEGLNRS